MRPRSAPTAMSDQRTTLASVRSSLEPRGLTGGGGSGVPNTPGSNGSVSGGAPNDSFTGTAVVGGHVEAYPRMDQVRVGADDGSVALIDLLPVAMDVGGRPGRRRKVGRRDVPQGVVRLDDVYAGRWPATVLGPVGAGTGPSVACPVGSVRELLGCCHGRPTPQPGRQGRR